MSDATDDRPYAVERAQVVAAAHRLAAEGLVLGAAGNVSARAGDRIAITATAAVLADLTGEHVAVVDLDGALVDGKLAPSSEIDLHLAIYRRYDAGAVVHSHAPVATALSCVIDELPIVHYGLLQLGGPVRVAPYRTFGTPELAAVTVDALEGRSAALMANHGAVVRARDLATAVEQSLLLEWACTVYWRAAAIGTPRGLTEQQSAAVLATSQQRNYGAPQRVEEER